MLFFAATCLIIISHQQKIQIMSYLSHFYEHKYRNKHNNQTNDPICFLSCIYQDISVLLFKSFKIQFYAVPCLHYVLVCKIHIYMPNIRLLSLKTQISFLYIEFASFWDITCFVIYLIPNPWTMCDKQTYSEVQKFQYQEEV